MLYQVWLRTKPPLNLYRTAVFVAAKNENEAMTKAPHQLIKKSFPDNSPNDFLVEKIVELKEITPRS